MALRLPGSYVPLVRWRSTVPSSVALSCLSATLSLAPGGRTSGNTLFIKLAIRKASNPSSLLQSGDFNHKTAWWSIVGRWLDSHTPSTPAGGRWLAAPSHLRNPRERA